MNPTLPHALITVEVKCDLCDCFSSQPTLAELNGSDYVLCSSCYRDNEMLIRDGIAKDMVGADASESDQEEL